jgi:ferric-dicitrate binding protein FerR (iron transport regulator)
MMRKHPLSITLALWGAALASGACSKDNKAPEPAASATAGTPAADNKESAKAAKVAPAEPISAEKMAEKTGMAPGAVQRSGAPIAVVAEAKGKVEIRPLGEPSFEAVNARAGLFAGDQIRTGVDGTAKIVLVDESVIELPADTAVAIADRDAQPAPASGAAVLSGAARFSVTPRAPGEGAFLVFTPNAIVAANTGAVLGVGVAANGTGRVGVETGEVTLAGMADLGKPTPIKAGFAVDVNATGALAAPIAFDGSGWAEWRVAAEAKAEPVALANARLEALRGVEAELSTGFDGLATLTDTTLSAEANVEARADANDLAGYQAAVPELGAEIEASYLTTLRLEQLSFAAAGDAYLVEDLYVHYPEVVAPVYVSGQVELASALLFSKKLHVICGQRIAPLRAAWYVDHPVGRLQAEAVGFVVPSFYAKATLKPIPAGMVQGHLGGAVAFMPPTVNVNLDGKAKIAHKVYIGVPDASWKSKLNVNVAPPAGGVAWYGKASGGLLVGVAPVIPNVSLFVRGKAAPLASLAVNVNGVVLVPAVKLKTDLRAKVGGEVGGKIDAAHDLKAGAKVKLHGIEGKAVDIKGKAGAGLDAAAKGAANVGGAVKGGIKAGVNVKVKAPPPPKVEVKAKGSIKAGGGIHLGN